MLVIGSPFEAFESIKDSDDLSRSQNLGRCPWGSVSIPRVWSLWRGVPCHRFHSFFWSPIATLKEKKPVSIFCLVLVTKRHWLPSRWNPLPTSCCTEWPFYMLISNWADCTQNANWHTHHEPYSNANLHWMYTLCKAITQANNCYLPICPNPHKIKDENVNRCCKPDAVSYIITQNFGNQQKANYFYGCTSLWSDS